MITWDAIIALLPPSKCPRLTDAEVTAWQARIAANPDWWREPLGRLCAELQERLTAAYSNERGAPSDELDGFK